jgi:hypothetical protein
LFRTQAPWQYLVSYFMYAAYFLIRHGNRLVRILIAAKLLKLFCPHCVIVVEEQNQCEHFCEPSDPPSCASRRRLFPG